MDAAVTDAGDGFVGIADAELGNIAEDNTIEVGAELRNVGDEPMRATVVKFVMLPRLKTALLFVQQFSEGIMQQ